MQRGISSKSEMSSSDRGRTIFGSTHYLKRKTGRDYFKKNILYSQETISMLTSWQMEEDASHHTDLGLWISPPVSFLFTDDCHPLCCMLFWFVYSIMLSSEASLLLPIKWLSSTWHCRAPYNLKQWKDCHLASLWTEEYCHFKKSSLFKDFHYLKCSFISCMWMFVHSVHMEARRQLVEVDSLLPLCGPWRSSGLTVSAFICWAISPVLVCRCHWEDSRK